MIPLSMTQIETTIKEQTIIKKMILHSTLHNKVTQKQTQNNADSKFTYITSFDQFSCYTYNKRNKTENKSEYSRFLVSEIVHSCSFSLSCAF